MLHESICAISEHNFRIYQLKKDMQAWIYVQCKKINEH